MEILSELKNGESQLTKIDSLIIKTIKTDPYSVLNMSIDDLAKKCFTTKASIVKTLKKIGINGYKELKKKISNQLVVSSASNKESSFFTRKVINALLSTELLIKEKEHEIEKTLLKKIRKCQKITVVAGGSLKYIALMMKDQFSKLGKKTEVYGDKSSEFWANKNYELIIFISNSGTNPNLYKKCSWFKKNNENLPKNKRTFLVSITASNTTNIKELVDLHIPGSKLFSTSKKDYHLPSISIFIIWFIVQNIIQKCYKLNEKDNKQKMIFI